MSSFDEFVRTATGNDHGPYPWQRRVAEEGLPELIAVETGAGKTEGVVLPWLYRRRHHPDPAVRAATPRWLVLCLPLRVLTEQVEGLVRTWLAALGELADDRPSDGVRVHVAMGGRKGATGEAWRAYPEDDAVVIGTVDMLLSRALNRGYALGRFNWPIDFGLLHNGCAWVFDEVQLLGPALPTSRQLAAFRTRFGTALPTSSTWMSATVDSERLRTVDAPEVPGALGLGPEDRTGELARRLGATRRFEEVDVADAKAPEADLAAAVVDAHRPGTRTIAVVNTIATARRLHDEISRRAGEVPVVLLHSRFRPPERDDVVRRALAPPGTPGSIVVSTQVLEAGVDISATTMLSEAAPWPSIVQRAGRCNRDGSDQRPDGSTSARLLWFAPRSPRPYPDEDVRNTVAALRRLEGREVSATELRQTEVEVTRPIHAVVRTSDLLGLFDTAPDLSGNDVDVGPFIREADDADVYLAWWDLGAGPPSSEVARVAADELCAVPLHEAQQLVERAQLWHFDHIDGGWNGVRRPREIRPGWVLVTDTSAGGYLPERGWDPSVRGPVSPLPALTQSDRLEVEEAIDADPHSYTAWVRLQRHLADVEAAVRRLLEALQPSGLPAGAAGAAALAGRLHDIGKVHPVFQDTMIRSARAEDQSGARLLAPWAKSGGSSQRHQRPHFRHELVSALMLLGEGEATLEGAERPDLVRYLVAAHHGRVRMAIRSVPDKEPRGTVLGVEEGERIPEVAVPDEGGGVKTLPMTTLSLEVARLGASAEGLPSWSERATLLLEELGPFRLAFLEAVVRLADWRASAAEARGASDL